MIEVHADIVLCGGGKGELCCAYLSAGPDGIICGREDAGLKMYIETRVNEDRMSAKRLPTRPFPLCQEIE